MLKGLGNLGEMAKMMKAAQEMQGRMAELQESLAHMTLTGEAGGGLVLVRCTGKGNITGIEISPNILHASEQAAVQSLILTAVQDAQARAQTLAAAELEKIAVALGLPADLKIPF